MKTPLEHLNDAWAKTNSAWGKTSLVLFYLLIWVGILKCVYGLFDPTMMGRMNCFMDNEEDDKNVFFWLIARGCFLYALGFLFYADRGGLHSWNVGFVAIICLVWIGITEKAFASMQEDLYEKCVGKLGSFVWIAVVWVIVAFVGIVVDERLTDEGTAEERANLNMKV